MNNVIVKLYRRSPTDKEKRGKLFKIYLGGKTQGIL